jgi:hypothetical protein
VAEVVQQGLQLADQLQQQGVDTTAPTARLQAILTRAAQVGADTLRQSYRF